MSVLRKIPRSVLNNGHQKLARVKGAVTRDTILRAASMVRTASLNCCSSSASAAVVFFVLSFVIDHGNPQGARVGRASRARVFVDLFRFLNFSKI